MQTNQLLLIFCSVLLILGLIAFFVGRSKAANLRASGTSMYAQPDQYAWFAVLSTAGPAVLVGVLGAFVLLLLGAEIHPLYLLSASLVVAAAGLAVGVVQVRANFHARKAIERIIRWVLAGAALISIFTTFGILFSIIAEALRFFQMHSFWEFITGTTWNPGASF
ncbi:MAG: phosphate ABC transporter permease family protein, partial [Pseudomonadota bacterium]